MAVDIVDELIGLERAFWDAMQDRDAETMARLTDDPSVITGAQGVGQVEPASFASMMEGATWKLESYRIDDPIVRALGDDTAIVAYTVHEQLTVDDEEVEFDAAPTRGSPVVAFLVA